MANKTEDIKILVQEVLQTISEPYGEDIIFEVCLKIEENPGWNNRYEALRKELRNRDVANNWIGKYTKELTGLRSVRQVQVPKGEKHIIASYTKLG